MGVDIVIIKNLLSRDLDRKTACIFFLKHQTLKEQNFKNFG